MKSNKPQAVLHIGACRNDLTLSDRNQKAVLPMPAPGSHEGRRFRAKIVRGWALERGVVS